MVNVPALCMCHEGKWVADISDDNAASQLACFCAAEAEK